MPEIFERANGVIYKRNFGQDPASRIPMASTQAENKSPMFRHHWVQILVAAETNPALQDALLNAVIIYELTRTKHD